MSSVRRARWLMSELPPIEKRMATILQLVAEQVRPCKACGEELAFVRHNNGKLTPYTLAGVNHFIDCPEAGQFKKRLEAE